MGNLSRQVKIRNLTIGGGSRIAVQSMTDLPVESVDETLAQIARLRGAGCDIVRIAVPNMRAAQAFAQVRKSVEMPLVADIHFDYRLAIAAIESGADKIRINPGNVPMQNLEQVIDCAKRNGCAIRIGVNGGSVNKEHLKLFDGDKNAALRYALEQYVKFFEKKNFVNTVLSVKSSDVIETIALNRKIAAMGYPLHLGVTEAGLPRQGVMKNAIGVGALLADGIGDTIRVSLTADPIEEVKAANEILSALNLRGGLKFVSCPKCGRCTVDLQAVASKVFERIKDIDKDIKVAVMGCEVNGPGECKDADFGLAGANGKFVFFKKGQIYMTVDAENAVDRFVQEVTDYAKDN